nr:T9SS type A sorting domain-containing protein [uncultured Bacteroides sp.]
MNFISNRILYFILPLVSLLPLTRVHADGSKDLYPNGVNGFRAYLLSNNNTVPNAIPFASRGAHYVYAKVGETITLASSEWSGSAAIKLFDPDNNDITPTRGTVGRIVDRNQELAGPKLTTTDATTNRYTPVYYSVLKEGIYKVEFWPRTNVSSTFSNATRNGFANTAWTNWNRGNIESSYIAAWDISVINNTKTAFIAGRVYANILNMGVLASSNTSGGYYGKMYVLTKDGYTYLVDNNGNNGIVFSFFVNNNGFVKGNNGVTAGPVDYTPIYKSLNTIDAAVTNKQIWNPNDAENNQNITHKMFYRLPSEDLPKDVLVKGDVPGGETWLKNSIVVPSVENPNIIGSDGTVGQISRKGGYVQFNTKSQGSYIVEISSIETPATFPTRFLKGTAVTGINRVLWDGKDGAGNPLPIGLFPAKVTVELQGAEVHFPYFDMENNINGIKLQLLDNEKLPGQIVVQSDIVYWNDADMPSPQYGSTSTPPNNSHLPPSLGGVSSTGIRSDGPGANGHKWGGNDITGTFGDLRSMDTWTFIKGEKKTVVGTFTINIADLKVTSVTTDKENNLHINDVVTYTVKVKNGELGDNGSDVTDAPFTFTLPPGFEEAATPMFSGNSCGTQSVAISYDATTRKYSSSLNLPNGCEVTYVFKATITAASIPNDTEAVATILRPNDVTDPDATNTSNPDKILVPDPSKPFDYEANFGDYYFPPTNPFFERKYNGLNGVCNNINTKVVSLIRQSDLAIDKSVDDSSPEVGNEVTFNLKITNHGPHDAANIIITDVVPDGYTIKTINNGGTLVNNTITWIINSLTKETDVSVSFTAIVLNEGNYLNTSTVTGDGEDSDLTNNTDTEIVSPCKEENIFTEDFGISPSPNSSNNFGRSTSIYMPSGSFKFGTSYPNSTDYNEYAIDNNHYAVVAPGYIKLGHKQYDYYFWTPSFNESNTIQDRSATENGAVMVVNAGQTLNSFYQRQELLQVGASYRASFWLYLVNGPSQVAIDVKHPKTGEVLATITSPILWDWDSKVKNKWTYFDLYFSVPVPDDEKNCTVDNVVLSFRNNYAENQGNDYYIDDIRLDRVCSVPAGTPILNCPDPNYKKNYWHGTVSNDWGNTDNWTAAFVPILGEDIEFATEVNNGTLGNGNGKGAAVRDLYLDTDRTIGSLINNSDVNMVVTTGNQLTINGTVKDDNPDKGTIIVKSETNNPTGTLLFSDPTTNTSVNATVEFINRAYECDNCGFYRKQWQYFGIPVKNANFPYQIPPVETINQWIEPYNGNKWRLAPVLPDLTLKAFNGYEITNSTNVEPTQVYNFAGVLNVGDAIVPSTKTVNVNYSGMNLIGNSFTAAIPITSAAIKLESVQLNENTVYLYNMGSRDQWRKLNGGTTSGIAAGQYQSVPFNVAGQAGIPDRILSMHTFMLNVTTPGNITLKYDQLVKNELNSSTISPWKSAKVKSNTTQLSHIVMDVIGSGSADRVWLFETPNATTGFDNGWDGYKIKEGELIQTYISGSDQSDYQIATVPEITGTTIDVKTESNESYSINLSVTPEVELRKLYLHDLLTGHSYPIVNNAEYLITGSGNSTGSRFKITSSSSSLIEDNNVSSSINIYVRNNSIVVENQSEEDCMATIYDVTGRLVASKQIQKNEITEFSEISQIKTGIYIVKVVGKTNSIHKTLKVK